MAGIKNKTKVKNSIVKINSDLVKLNYSCIKQPTLFIRYCLNQEEVFDIDKRYSDIANMIKSFNEYNEIVFLTHDIDDYSTAYSNLSTIATKYETTVATDKVK